MRVSCIIQARTGSTRLPNKVLLKVSGKEILLHVIDRVLAAKTVNEVIIATTTNKNDDAIVALVEKLQNPRVHAFRGSEEDVLDRYYQAARLHNAGIVVRITSDCPLIDGEVIDMVVKEFKQGSYDYVSNVLEKRTFPRGLDVECLSFGALEKMWTVCTEKREREHVTIYIHEHPDKFKTKNILNRTDLSMYRWTLDEIDDFRFIEAVYEHLYDNKKTFKTRDILQLLKKHPELAKLNEHVEQKKIIKNEQHEDWHTNHR